MATSYSGQIEQRYIEAAIPSDTVYTVTMTAIGFEFFIYSFERIDKTATDRNDHKYNMSVYLKLCCSVSAVFAVVCMCL